MSIPAAVAQAEGIKADAIASQNPNLKTVKHAAIERWTKGIAQSDPLGGLLIVDWIATWMNQSTLATGNSGKVSRHEILHGMSCNYGTRWNSASVILWIDVLLLRIAEIDASAA